MNEMTTLQNIERRIALHMQGAYANILEVGRCLIEAKEANVVPHGQWEAWGQRTAGMSERSAQRLMQAAREVSPESAMAKLPISKIQAILALPDNYKSAVYLFYYEGYSTREMAELLSLPEATVRTHLARGRARLKTILTEADAYDGQTAF